MCNYRWFQLRFRVNLHKREKPNLFAQVSCSSLEDLPRPLNLWNNSEFPEAWSIARGARQDLVLQILQGLHLPVAGSFLRWRGWSHTCHAAQKSDHLSYLSHLDLGGKKPYQATRFKFSVTSGLKRHVRQTASVEKTMNTKGTDWNNWDLKSCQSCPEINLWNQTSIFSNVFCH